MTCCKQAGLLQVVVVLSEAVVCCCHCPQKLYRKGKREEGRGDWELQDVE